MRICVTGATGFLGSHFVERALSEQHEVTALYRSSSSSSSGSRQALISRFESLGVRAHQGSVLDPGSLAGSFDKVGCVCHFAGAFRETGVSDEYFIRLNVEGTANVVRAAAAAGVDRVVLCSTAGIFGSRVPGVIRETAAAAPWNIYEESKLAGELELKRLSSELGVDYVILRPSAVYGPRDERLLKLFRSAAKGRFPLFGPGDGRRHMVYVTDVAAAFLQACVQPAASRGEFFIAGPSAVPLRVLLDELAQVVGRASCGPRLPLKPMLALSALVEDGCRALGVRPPIYRRRMDFYLNDAEFDCSHARRLLNWEPRVDLPQGLALTLNSYVEEGWIDGPNRTL